MKKSTQKNNIIIDCWEHKSYRCMTLIIFIISLLIWKAAWSSSMAEQTDLMRIYPVKEIMAYEELFGVYSFEIVAVFLFPFMLWVIGMVIITTVYSIFKKFQ